MERYEWMNEYKSGICMDTYSNHNPNNRLACERIQIITTVWQDPQIDGMDVDNTTGKEIKQGILGVEWEMRDKWGRNGVTENKILHVIKAYNNNKYSVMKYYKKKTREKGITTWRDKNGQNK